MLAIYSIYETYRQDVFRYLVSLTHDSLLSEDLVSETFLGAIKALPNFKGDSDIKTWLFSIARYKWYEHLRKKRETLSFESLAENYIADDGFETAVFHRELSAKILALLEKEPERTRTIVLMRVEGFSFYEIAAQQGISENSARIIDFRAKKKIKTILLKEDADYE